MERNINRIKVVLVDKRKTNKWLSEQLGVAPTTVLMPHNRHLKLL